MNAIKGIVKGRVQGVFFRVSAKARAQALGLCGWVRNTAAGDVEFVVAGEQRALAVMEQWLNEGPNLARVDHLYVEHCQIENLAGFAIRD